MRGRLVLSTVFFSTAALVLWTGAAAATWGDFLSGRGLTVQAVGAGTATLLAWYSWRELDNRDRAMMYLVDCAVTSRRAAAQTATAPLRAVPAQATQAPQSPRAAAQAGSSCG